MLLSGPSLGALGSVQPRSRGARMREIARLHTALGQLYYDEAAELDKAKQQGKDKGQGPGRST